MSLVALCFVAVLGIALASYLALTTRTMQLSNRSYQAGLSQKLAEFGLEEGLRAFNNNDWSNWSSSPTNMTSGAWTRDASNKRATRTISFANGKLGQGVTATVKIRVDNYDAAQLSHTWNSGKSYQINELVGYNGVWYRCLAANSNQQPPNLNYWADEGMNWAWNSSVSYSVGDFVNDAGVWYRCKTAHSTPHQPPNGTYWVLTNSAYLNSTPNPYPAEGLLFWSGSWVRLSNSPPWTWDNSSTPINWRWASGVTYAFGDAISDPTQSNLVWKRCIASHTSSWSPNVYSSTSLWRATTWFWTWSASNSYNPGDVAYYGSAWYRCVRANLNQAPSASSDYWASGPLFSQEWDASRSYSANDIVFYNGVWYLCILACNGRNPSTETNYWVGADTSNSSYTWNRTTNYSAGAFRCYAGAWYKCLLAGNSGIAPGNSTYWGNAWTNSFGITTGVPVVSAEAIISLGDGSTTRTQLRGTLVAASAFPNAIAANGDVTISAATGTVDSYDSRSGTYSSQVSTNTNYSAVIAAGGNLAINATTNVRGYLAWPSPPSGISTNTTVWGPADASPTKVNNNRVSRSPDLPQMAIRSVAAGYTLSLTNNTSYVLGTPGATTPTVYSISSASNSPNLVLNSSSEVLTIVGPVILDVSGNLQISSGKIVVASTGSAEIHFSGRLNVSNSSGGLDNTQTKDPRKLILLGTSSLTTHQILSTTYDFYGLVYLPNGSLTISNSPNIYGAVSANNVTFGDAAKVHYDVSLRYASISGLDQPYMISEWRELPQTEWATMP